MDLAFLHTGYVPSFLNDIFNSLGITSIHISPDLFPGMQFTDRTVLFEYGTTHSSCITNPNVAGRVFINPTISPKVPKCVVIGPTLSDFLPATSHFIESYGVSRRDILRAIRTFAAPATIGQSLPIFVEEEIETQYAISNLFRAEGAVIFRGSQIIMSGPNYNIAGFEVCAAEGILIEVDSTLKDLSLAIMADNPFTLTCAKLSLIKGIREIWTLSSTGWVRHDIDEFITQCVGEFSGIFV